jgi:hypothetical protein
MINSRQLFVSITVGMLCLSAAAEAQRGGRGGGGRGGGGRDGGGFRGGGMASRGGARTSVNLPSGGGRAAQLPANINRPSGGINRPAGGINAGYGNINRGNINVDRGNINVNRPVSIGDGDWDNNYRPGSGCCYHPVARVAAATAAVATAAAIGSVAYTLPASCSIVVVNGLTYQQCGSTWYQPQFVGDETTYMVVSPPD